MAKMDEQELAALLKNELENGLGNAGGRLAMRRLENQKVYMGDPYGNERAGRSKVVTRDTFDAVEWIMPSLIKTFAGADDVVEFKPKNEAAQEQASVISEWVNYVVTQQNPGYSNFTCWFRDALISGNSWVKVYRDESTKAELEKYEDVSQYAINALLNQDGVEAVKIVQCECEENIVDAITGALEVKYDIDIRRTETRGKTCWEVIPPDQIVVNRAAISLDTCSFISHRMRVTKTDLLNMGYDKSVVVDLPMDTSHDWDMERVERHIDDGFYPYGNRLDESMQEIWLSECYMKVDWDGDGKAELRKITIAGESNIVILDNEEIDTLPFVHLTALPIPHKLHGQGIVDITKDIQQLNTTIVRATLDNFYISSNPRIIYKPGNSATRDDLLNFTPGAPIRAEDPSMIQVVQVPFVGQQAFPLLEYTAKMRTARSGVSEAMTGVNPNILQSETATGVNAVADDSAQKIELFIRQFAETGVKDLFKKVFEFECKYGDKQASLMINNEWKTIDPTMWRNDYDLIVNVGLGTNNKTKTQANLASILAIQKAAIEQQGGVEGPLVTLENVYNTVSKIAEASGYKNTALFFSNPSNVPVQPKQPKQDPNMMIAQSQIAVNQSKIQLDQQKAQLEAQKAQMDMQLEREKMQLDMQLEREKAAIDKELKLQQFQFEKELKLMQMKHEAMAGQVQTNVTYGGGHV